MQYLSIKAARPSKTLKPTTAQWLLALISLLIASFSYLAPDYGYLVQIAWMLGIINLILVATTLPELFQARVAGKLLIVSSVLFFFWMEAIGAAQQDPAFAAPEGLQIFAGQFDLALVQKGFFYIALFQIMLLVGYSIQPRLHRFISWTSTRIDAPYNRTRLLRYVIAACAIIPVLLAYGFNVDNALQVLISSRAGTEVQAQDIGLWHFLSFFGMYGAALFLSQAIVSRSWARIKNLLIGVVAALPFVLSGARHLWLFVALPGCLLFLKRFKGNFNPGRAARWGIVTLLLIVVVQLQYDLRNKGWQEIGGVTASNLVQLESTGQFQALMFAEYLVPDIHEYFMEPAEPFFLIHWIPRRFWPAKPIMASWDYYNSAYTQGGAFNVTPSVIGQFHMNWGILGVMFIGLWLGFLAALTDRVFLAIDLARQHAMAVMVGMFYAFIVSSFRFYHPLYFAYFLFAFIAMLFLTRKANFIPDRVRYTATVPQGTH